MQDSKKVNCPACRQPFAISDFKPGASVACPHCGKKLRLPDAANAASKSAATKPPEPQRSPQEILLDQMRQASDADKKAADADKKAADARNSAIDNAFGAPADTPRPTAPAGTGHAGRHAATNGASAPRRPVQAGRHSATANGLRSSERPTVRPPRSNRTLGLVWGIISMVALVLVVIGLVVKANWQSSEAAADGVAETVAQSTTQTPSEGAQNAGTDANANVAQQADAPQQPQNALAADAREPDDAAPASPGAEASARNAAMGRLDFKDRGSVVTLLERPNMMFQVIEATNNTGKTIRSGKVDLTLTVDQSPHKSFEFPLFDLKPKQSRLLVAAWPVPANSNQMGFQSAYNNLTLTESPRYDLQAEVVQVIRDGRSDGTVEVRLQNKSTQNIPRVRLQLVLMRANGDFCGYEEMIAAPLAAGQERIQQMRWNDWPSHWVEKEHVVVAAEGLTDEEAAALPSQE